MYGGKFQIARNTHRALPRPTVAPPTSTRRRTRHSRSSSARRWIRSSRPCPSTTPAASAISVPPQRSSAPAASFSTPSWACRYSSRSFSLSCPAQSTDGSTRCRWKSPGVSSAIPMTFASARPFPSAATESIPPRCSTRRLRRSATTLARPLRMARPRKSWAPSSTISPPRPTTRACSAMSTSARSSSRNSTGSAMGTSERRLPIRSRRPTRSATSWTRF
mmetsp:Transcript_6781/g.27673  ORF Transcript_6781/g.27673 Transcript_6781/m.27673 type:complete len:220 (+) Transcript_6781:606-1265(+)